MRNVDILLVEDNEADIVLMREALKDAEVANVVHVAHDGEEAVKFLRKDKVVNPDGITPGIILLDLYMPKMGGMEVLAIVKGDSELKRIPVVMMTSSREESDVVQAYDLQANSYVIKPVDFKQLISVTKTFENFWLSTAQLPQSKRPDSEKPHDGE